MSDGNDLVGALVAIILVVGAGIVYFVPTFIAVYKQHPNVLAVFFVNLLLGGCFGIGWVVALIWAVMAIDAEREYR